MPGGNVGHDVLVDLSTGFGSVLAFDPESQRMTVGPGVTAARVDATAATHGLAFPVLPSSAEWCTIGGMVANNAAGALSFSRGAIAPWVEALEVVDANGRVHRLERGRLDDGVYGQAARRAGVPQAWPRVRKNSSGFGLDRFAKSGDAIDVVVGSEGTLGLITKVTLRLEERAEDRMVAALRVADVAELSAWRGWADQQGFSACEFLGRWLVDRSSLELDPELAGLADGAFAILILESRGPKETTAQHRTALEAEAARRGSPFRIGLAGPAADRLWTLRHRASPAIAQAAGDGYRSMQFIEDCVVPTPALGAYLEGLDSILARFDIEAAIFGHAGDAHVHVNPLVPMSAPDWRARVRGILDDTTELIARLGGTLAGEHGDGRLRAPLLERVWSADAVSRFRALKQELDPQAILNPGVILALPDQDPLENLLHDGDVGP